MQKMSAAPAETRMALGRFAKLGDMFDARKDHFFGISTLIQEPPNTAVTCEPKRHTDIQYILQDKVGEKCEKLHLEGELKASFLCGLTRLGGHGSYLSREKMSKRSAECSMMYEISTCYERLNVWDPTLRNCFSTDAIERCQNATHIVVGIYWGAKCVATVRHDNEDNEDRSKIVGQLELRVKQIEVGIGGEVDRDHAHRAYDRDIKVEFAADVHIEDIPQNIDDAISIMKTIPTLIKQNHNEKGIQLKYELFPLSILQSYLMGRMECDRMVRNIDNSQLVKIEQLIEAVTDSKSDLQDFLSDLQKDRKLIPDFVFRKVSDAKEALSTREARVQSQLQQKLLEYRSGANNLFDIETIENDYRNDDIASPEAIRALIAEFDCFKQKIQFAKEIAQFDVKFAANEEALSSVQRNHKTGTLYVLFLKTDNEKCTNECKDLFYAICSEKNADEWFAIADLDVCLMFHVLQGYGFGTRICLFQNGHYEEFNFLQKHSDQIKFCYARTEVPRKPMAKPSKRIPVEFSCPQSQCDGGCDKAQAIWKCEKCNCFLEYGFDNNFYCNCGRAPYSSFRYRCNDRKHGRNFVEYEETQIFGIIMNWQTIKEYNILVLGETGVGKSTWINALANYKEYDSLELALNHDPIVLIPSSFEITGSDLKRHTVKTDANDPHPTQKAIGEQSRGTSTENLTPGEASTQKAGVYPFRIDNKIVRIIDTPGIGDPRGIEKDQENLEDILAVLGNYDFLHGIIIMLKPNNSTLTVGLQFCVQELFRHLHRSAKDNVVFCFTNTRGHFYQPGDTLPPLRKMLQEIQKKGAEIPLTHETMYCMDNEAFRLLSAKHFGVPLEENIVADYSKSWKRSVDETNRMLDHFFAKEPHDINEMLCLNEARSIIRKLLKPMAEMSAEIQQNLNIITEKGDELEKLKAGELNLKSKLKIEQIQVEPIPLAFSRTVCANAKCIEFVPILGTNETQTVYKSICHDQCDIPGIDLGNCPNPAIKTCRAFKPQHFGGALRSTTENCQVCGCSWEHHIHTKYEYIRKNVEIDDGNIVKQLEGNITETELIKARIKTCSELKTKLETELAEIREIAAFFASFLKANSITPHNDAFAAYVKQQILIQEAKSNIEGNSAVVTNLTEHLMQYKQQVLLLDQQKSSDGASCSIVNVKTYKERLFRLPVSGSNLRAVFEMKNSSLDVHPVLPTKTSNFKRLFTSVP